MDSRRLTNFMLFVIAFVLMYISSHLGHDLEMIVAQLGLVAANCTLK